MPTGTMDYSKERDRRLAAQLSEHVEDNLEAYDKLLRPVHIGTANRDIAQANLVWWGTSMTEGGPLSGETGPTYRWRRWLDKLQVNLRGAFPLTFPATGSLGYIPAFYQTFIPGGTLEHNRYTPEGVSYSGALTAYGSGLGSRSLGLAAIGDWVQFTFTGDAFELFLSTHTTASTVVSISVDGGLATNYTLPASTLKSDRYVVTGLSVGSHTVRATFNTGVVVVDGLKPYNGDRGKGIHIWDAGKGSAKIFDIGTSSAYRGFQQAGLLNPCLVAIEYGYNEYFSNVALSTFKTNLENFTSGIKANITSSCAYVYIIWPEPTRSGTPVAPYKDYVNVIREVASANNAAVIDFSKYAEGAADNTLGLFYDGVHFTSKGNAYVADILSDILVSKSR